MLELNFTPFPIIDTKRLVLRKVEETDINEIFILRSDERVMKYIERAPAQSPEDASLFIQIIHNLEHDNDGITWAITIKGQVKLIGTIGFWKISKEHHRAEIGYVLLPDFHGKGIMQEAMQVVLEYGFKNMKLHSVEANINPKNISSMKLLERNKFMLEGSFKENYFYNGKYFDTATYSLLSPIE